MFEKESDLVAGAREAQVGCCLSMILDSRATGILAAFATLRQRYEALIEHSYLWRSKDH